MKACYWYTTDLVLNTCLVSFTVTLSNLLYISMSSVSLLSVKQAALCICGVRFIGNLCPIYGEELQSIVLKKKRYGRSCKETLKAPNESPGSDMSSIYHQVQQLSYGSGGMQTSPVTEFDMLSRSGAGKIV